jgi:hypothetical protein
LLLWIERNLELFSAGVKRNSLWQFKSQSRPPDLFCFTTCTQNAVNLDETSSILKNPRQFGQISINLDKFASIGANLHQFG